MGTLSLAAQLILSLSILVILHECGHFFPARWFNTRVEKFYLFFNPGFSLFKKQIGETEYGIGWIPFGGYVKIAGMIDESMDTEQLEAEPQPWEFRSKPAWQRLIIMLGGVTVNFILGFLIFAGMLWYYGTSYIQNTEAQYGVIPTEIGNQIGIQKGDKIISIGDVKFEKFNPGIVSQEIVLNDPEFLVVNRNGQNVNLTIPERMAETLTKHKNKGVGLFNLNWPQEVIEVASESLAEKIGLQKGDRIIGVDTFDTHQLVDFSRAIQNRKNTSVDLTIQRGPEKLIKKASFNESGVLGVSNKIIKISKRRFTFAEAIPGGYNKSIGFLKTQFKAFGRMFSGKIKAKDSLGSVFSIATMFDKGWNWEVFWNITASLSILLGFFNLLPIPALDGGYVMFLLWEVITGRKPNDKFMEYATMVGFFILIGLMIFAIGLDISKWI
ncbi:MAG: RIP metalloprotease RseP [Saprospiraceae bacterium]